MAKASQHKKPGKEYQKSVAGYSGNGGCMEASCHAGLATAKPVTQPLSSTTGNKAVPFAAILPSPAISTPVVQRVGISDYFRNNHMAANEERAVKNAGWHNGAVCTSVEANSTNSDKIRAVKGGKNADVTLPGMSYWKVNKATKKATKYDSGDIDALTNADKEVFHISRS